MNIPASMYDNWDKILVYSYLFMHIFCAVDADQ